MITNAEYKGGYKILVTFDDGTKRLADFESFIKTHKFPYVRKYADLNLFQQFYFNDWGLCWGEYFDINPQNIYDGKYEAKTEDTVTA